MQVAATSSAFARPDCRVGHLACTPVRAIGGYLPTRRANRVSTLTRSLDNRWIPLSPRRGDGDLDAIVDLAPHATGAGPHARLADKNYQLRALARAETWALPVGRTSVRSSSKRQSVR